MNIFSVYQVQYSTVFAVLKIQNTENRKYSCMYCTTTEDLRRVQNMLSVSVSLLQRVYY
jgi:hypothetical protein